MAGTIKGITVQIGGETTGLSKALQDVNTHSSSIAKELREVDKLLKFDPSNADLLAQKQKLLGDAVDAASEKVKKLHDAQADVEKQFASGKISGEAYRDFQREVIKAEAALQKAETAVSDFSKEADDGAENVAELADNTEDAAEAADKAEGKFDKLGSVAQSVGSAFAAVGAAIGTTVAAISAAAGAAVSAMADMTQSAAVYADDIATLSTQTGVSTESLQAYQYAAELVDVSLDTLTGSMAKQIKSMTSATQGSKNYVAAYEQLGVAITDANGNMRDSEEVYWDVIDALGKVENETERDSIAMTLLGKSAQDLNPLISLGTDALGDLMQEAKDAGAVLSEDTLESLLGVSDAMERMKSSTQAAQNNLGTLSVGALTEYYSGATNVIQDFTKIVQAAANGGKIGEELTAGLTESITAMADGVAAEIPGILDVVSEIVESVLQAVGDALPSVVETISTVFPKLLSTISGMLPELLRVVVSVLNAVVKSISEATPDMTSAITETLTTITSALIDALPGLMNCGAQMITSLVAGIAEALPELIPAAVEAITTIVQGLVDALPQILDAALQIILGLAQGLLDALPQLIEALPGIITGIVDFLIDAVPQITDAGIALLTSLVDALPDIIDAIVEAVPQIIGGIVDALLGSLPEIIEAGIQLFTALVEAMPEIITAIVEALPELIGGIVDALMDSLPLLIDAGFALFTALLGDIPAIIDDLWEKVPEIILGIVKAVISCRQKIVDAGNQLIQGLWQGISDAKEWLLDKIGGFFDGVVGSIKDFFGIHSPSTLFRDEIGKYLAEGIGIGFSDEMENVTKDMQDALPTEFDTAVNAAYRYSVGDDGERNFELVTPISIGGQKLTKVVSRVQYNTRMNRARVVGVSAE